MQYANLGSSGLQVSRICLGMLSYGDPAWRDWILPEDDSRPFIRRAAELGINFFDTADVYSAGCSEEVSGRLLRKVFPRREDYVLASKVGLPMGEGPNDCGLSRSHIIDSCEASLRRLGTDHIDLYQIHRWDPETPIAETMQALDDLVRSGKVRYIGASSMWAWQLAKAQYTAELRGWTRFVSMQNHYNLLYREQEREVLGFLADQGMACVPWGPLARGRLGRADQPDPSRGTDRSVNDAYADRLYAGGEEEILHRVAQVSRDRGVSTGQVALAWLLRNPVVTAPALGVRKMEQLEQAAGAVDVQLTDEEAAYLEEPYRPMPVREHD